MNKKILFLIPIVFLITFGFLMLKNNNKIVIESDNPKKLASYSDVLDEDKNIENTEFVKFDAYFLVDKDNDGYADKIRGNSLSLDDTGKLNIDLNVTGDVVFKNVKISFINSNVKIGYKGSYTSEISFDSINGGTNRDLKVMVNSQLTNDILSYNGTNKVLLTGILVENGVEKEITKEVSYIMDWYSKGLRAYVNRNVETNYEIKDDTIFVSYKFKTYSNIYSLLKSVNMTADVSLLNGFAPKNVRVEGTNYTSNYDPNTRKLSVSRNSELVDTRINNSAYDYVSQDLAINNYNVIIEYPVEAGYKDTAIPLNVNVYYEQYNNPDSDFQNILTSNTASYVFTATNKADDIVESINEGGPIPYMISARTDIYSNSVNKTSAFNLYDGIEADKTTDYNYSLETRFYYSLGKVNKLIVWDNDYDKFNGNDSMMNVSKYKSIRFINNLTDVFGVGGYIKMINAETNETIHIFTSNDWNNEYIFETDVRKLYFETSEVTGVSRCYAEWDKKKKSYKCHSYSTAMEISITKEIDNEMILSSYTKEHFLNLSSILTEVNTNMETENESVHYLENESITVKSTEYSLPKSSGVEISIFEGNLSNNTNFILPTGKQVNSKITIEIGRTPIIQGATRYGWRNGEFLVEFPDEIINLKVNNISLDCLGNQLDNYLDGYEIKKINGKHILKIYTLNEEDIKYCDINVNADLVADPRSSDTNVNLNVYGLNKYYDLSDWYAKDKYDMDNDGSTEDFVNFGSTSFDITADDEIKTVTSLHIFDENNNEIETIAPNTAEINPISDKEKAQVEIGLYNHSAESTKNVKIIGKIGYIGNTYQLSDIGLESEFNVTMSNNGVLVPSKLNDNVIVYYSTKEKPTDDINNVENNWNKKEDVTDFNEIKSFMIIVEDYVINPGENISFRYEVNVPMTTNLLYKSTYFTHAVYYDKIEDGIVVSANPIEQRKTRLMITRKYNLDLRDYRTESTNSIKNSSYELVDEEGNKFYIKTNSEGKYIVEGLYVDKEYKIIQRNIDYPFVIDSEEKKFTVINNSTDELELTNLTGSFKSITISNSILNMILENETRYDLILKNTDLDTNSLIPLSKFTISGKGYENGKDVITNFNGELSLRGLYINEIYTVNQTRSSEHITLSEPFTFMLRRNPNTGKISVSRDITLQSQEEYGDSIPFNNTNGLINNGVFYEMYSKTTPGAVDEAYIVLDLTDNIYQYKFEYDVYKNYSARNTYGYEHKFIVVTDINHIPDLPAKGTGYDDDHDHGLITSAYNYNSSTNSFEQVPLEGGRKYYIYMYLKNTTSGYSEDKYSYVIIRQLMKIDDSTNDTLYSYSKTNIPVYSNPNVLQTIIESDSLDIPKFIVNVKSKKIPTYNLELTKVSADTKLPLSNAQYKISGPGLPYNGLYIKTDENGKATINLRMGTTIDAPSKYEKIVINGFNYGEVNTNYSIQEVTPPTGYQLDDKIVSFDFVKSYKNDNCVETGIYSNLIYSCYIDDNTEFTNKLIYNNDNSKFVEYEIIDDTNTLKVTVYDYPLVKISKKDSETGEFLPNTLFAIYSVTTGDLGIELLTPAKDSKGNILGQLVTINGTNFYVLATDENGILNIDLSSGDYKAIEVQATDEKYELSTQNYYFTIGPTKEHVDGKLQYMGSINEKNNGFKYYSESSDIKFDDIIPTSDGGWIVAINDLNEGTYDYGWDGRKFNPDHVVAIVKYDKNLNKEWQSDVKFQYVGGVTQYRYFDDKDRVEYDNEHDVSYVTGRQNIYVDETEDGYYVTSYSMGVVKIDKQGNRLWQNQYYATSNLVYYTALCDKDTGELVSDNEYVTSINPYDSNNPHIQKDNKTYYCTINDVFDKTYEVSGGILKWLVYNSDGPSETMPERLYDDTSYENTTYEYEYSYDNDGNINGVKKVWSVLTPTLNQKNNVLRFGVNDYRYASYEVNGDAGRYIKNLTATKDGGVTLLQSDSLRWQPDGNFILSDGTIKSFNNYSVHYRIKGNECDVLSSIYESRDECNLPITPYKNNDKLLHYTSDGRFVSVDDLGRLKYFAVTKYNEIHGTTLSVNYSSWNTTDDIKTFENGDLLYISGKNGIMRLKYDTQKYKYEPVYYIPPDGLLSSDPGKWEVQITGNSFIIAKKRYYDYSSDSIIYYIDENGNLSEDVKITSEEESLNYVRANGERNISGFYKLSNGNYLVYGQINKLYSQSNSGLQDNTITLGLNGQLVQKSLNVEADKLYFIIYEVNSDSKILWYKLFDITNNFGTEYDDYWTFTPIRYNKVSNEVLFVISKGQNLNLKNVDNPSENYTAKGNILVFNLIDENKPESPEAYSIEILNNRKIFKVNVESGSNGKTEILNNNNIINTINNEQKSIENIKYGDNSIYKIKVTPDAGYVIDKVLLNDEEYSYSALNDGSIILDDINDVKEEKNIKITFKPGNSIVIVHHYIKGTETKIASDEIISGVIPSLYETEPTLNELYSLEKDSNGEYIIPDNYKGMFKYIPTIVTYYYVENNVNLKTNYYKENTTIELAPSKVERKLLGSTYKTSPLNIEFYDLVKVIGNEEGTLDKENTEVTYMYKDNSKVNINVKYLEKDTNNALSDEFNDILERHQTYEMVPLNINTYKLVDKTSNYKGKAESQNIEVIFCYEKIKSNITVKYIDKDNNKELIDSISFTKLLNEDYITEEKNIENYKLVNKTDNYKGKADGNNIEVVYYYEKMKSNIIVKYIDKDINVDLIDSITISKYFGDTYEIKEETINNFKLVDKTSNYKGIVSEELIEVIFYYEKLNSNITVKYIDINTDKEISKSDIISKKVNEEYEIEDKNIKNYKLVDKTSNYKGIVGREDIVVIYYYEKINNTKTKEEKNTMTFIIDSKLKVSANEKIEENTKEVLGANIELPQEKKCSLELIIVIISILSLVSGLIINKK